MRDSITRRRVSLLCAAVLSLSLVACGGGGGGGNRNDGGPTGTPPTGVNGVAQFDADSFVVNEAAGTATITLTRFGSPSNEISAFILTVSSDNGGKEGIDYGFVSKEIKFAAGDTAPKTLTVNITNDQFDEADEVIKMTLNQSASTNRNGVLNASRDVATLVIRDDDTFSGAQFSADTYSVSETTGAASITLMRQGSGSEEITATVSATGGTATIGRDYNTADARVVFPAGDNTPKTLSFNILDDLEIEGTENITLTLRVTAPAGAVPPQEGLQAASIRITDDNDASNTAVPLRIVSTEPKTLVLNFDPTPGAVRYRLMRSLLTSRTQPVGAEILPSAREIRATVGLHLGETLRLDACDNFMCRPSSISIVPGLRGTFAATGYLKANDTAANQALGTTVAVSDDGTTIALGAPGANGNAGAVYVYRKAFGDDKAFASQPIRIAAPTTLPIRFGASVALNSTGSVLLIGAPADPNTVVPTSTRYPGAGTENQAAPGSGAAFQYQLPDTDFDMLPAQPVLDYRYIKTRQPRTDDAFGTAVALADNESGPLLIVGAPGEDGTAADSGAVFLYSLFNTVLLEDLVKASNNSSDDIQAGARFGTAVAVSAENAVESGIGGKQLVVGAPGYRTSLVAGSPRSGAAYVYPSAETDTFLPKSGARLEPTNPSADDQFGAAVATSRDALTIAVGAPGKAVPFRLTDQPMNPGTGAGAVFVFRGLAGAIGTVARTQTPAFFTSRPAAPNTRYGTSVALNADGSILAAGVPGDSEFQVGVFGAPAMATSDTANAGAVFLLQRPTSDWSQFTMPRGTQPTTRYVKASNTEQGDLFGTAVALSADGTTLIVGAPGESGKGTNLDKTNKPFDPNGTTLTIDAKQSDNSATRAGAGYLY